MDARAHRWGAIAAAPGVAAGGFLVFRPDWYHMQNGLDPFFYTGMSLDLSNVIDQGAAAHYFMSRWTLYIPELLTERAFGAVAGFVVFRLLLLTLAAVAVFALRRTSGRRVDFVPVAIVSLFAPIMMRAVFVDYSDAIVVPCGLAMIALAARAPVRWSTAAAIGALAGAALVANVFAVFMLALSVAVYAIRSRAERRMVAGGVVAAAAASAVVLSGWLFFRLRYGIDNVYDPTIDFIQDNPSFDDPLRSPRLLWLGYRLWIYLPAITLLVAFQLWRQRLVEFSRSDRLILGLCAAQYLFQIAYQFGRGGTTLELHYYFSYMVPAYTAALAVVLYAALERCSVRAVYGLTAGVTALFLAMPALVAVRFPSWVYFGVAVVAGGLVLARLAASVPVVVPVILVFIVLAVQVAFPRGEPRGRNEERAEATFDLVYASATSPGVVAFKDVVALTRQLKRFDVEVLKQAGFILTNPVVGPLGAAYSVHVAQPTHWLNPPWVPGARDAPFHLGPSSVDLLRSRQLRYVILIGAFDEVSAAEARFAALGVRAGDRLLDWRTPSMGARVVVAKVEDA